MDFETLRYGHHLMCQINEIKEHISELNAEEWEQTESSYPYFSKYKTTPWPSKELIIRHRKELIMDLYSTLDYLQKELINL